MPVLTMNKSNSENVEINSGFGSQLVDLGERPHINPLDLSYESEEPNKKHIITNEPQISDNSKVLKHKTAEQKLAEVDEKEEMIEFNPKST